MKRDYFYRVVFPQSVRVIQENGYLSVTSVNVNSRSQAEKLMLELDGAFYEKIKPQPNGKEWTELNLRKGYEYLQVQPGEIWQIEDRMWDLWAGKPEIVIDFDSEYQALFV